MTSHFFHLFDIMLPMRAIVVGAGEVGLQLAKFLVSEGIDANYQDMVNYAVFAMIHLNANS